MCDEVQENKIETFNCEKHGAYSGTLTILKPLFPGSKPMEIKPDCPLCEQEEKERVAREKLEDDQNRFIRKMESMNIDKKFYESTFDNFNAYNDELKKHLAACRAFADNPDGKILMIGENGNGKTHLAISILKKLGGVIYTASEMSIEIKSSYNGERSEKEFFDEICSVPLLVIDEVEKIKKSEWKDYWMSHIVNKRYNRMLPIIFIANCHTKKDCPNPNPPCDRCVEYHLENDVLSRIIEDGIIMKFHSGDYRQKLRNERFGQQK